MLLLLDRPVLPSSDTDASLHLCRSEQVGNFTEAPLKLQSEIRLLPSIFTADFKLIGEKVTPYFVVRSKVMQFSVVLRSRRVHWSLQSSHWEWRSKRKTVACSETDAPSIFNQPFPCSHCKHALLLANQYYHLCMILIELWEDIYSFLINVISLFSVFVKIHKQAVVLESSDNCHGSIPLSQSLLPRHGLRQTCRCQLQSSTKTSPVTISRAFSQHSKIKSYPFVF